MPAVTTTTGTNPSQQKPVGNLPFIQDDQLTQPVKPMAPLGGGTPQQATQPIGSNNAFPSAPAPAPAPAPIPAPAPAAAPPPSQAALQGGSANVMQGAQNLALNSAAPSGLMNSVQKQAQGLVDAPELITDKYIQNQLGQYDRNRADQFQSFNQQFADSANTGPGREAAFNFAMEGAQGRTDLGSALDFQKEQVNRSAMLEALGLGGSVAQQASGMDTEALNRLLNTRAGFEGERSEISQQGFQREMTGLDQAFQMDYLSQDQVGQQALTELKGKIDSGLQVSAQDFQGVQASLDRALTAAENAGDRAAAEQITRLKGDIDAASLATQQGFQREMTGVSQQFEREMTGLDQAFKMDYLAQDQEGQAALTELKGKIDQGLMVTGQDFQAAQSSLDRALTAAENAGDRASAEQLTILKGEIDAASQQADNDFKMQYQFLDNENQQGMLELKYALDSEQLMQSQDFAGNQAALDRDLERYRAEGDWENVEKITNLKAELDAVATEKQQEWQSAENTVNRAWSSDERISAENFERGMAYTEIKAAEARAAKDHEQEKDIFKLQETMQLKMQIQDFDNDTQMLRLDDELSTARADGDVVRQQAIMEFQNALTIDQMAAQLGNDEALAQFKGNISEMLANNDHENAMAAIATQNNFIAREASLDREVDLARVALAERGVDMAEVEAQYNFLLSEAAAGRANPDAAFNFVQGELADNGVTIDKSEPAAVYQQMQDDFKEQQFQYGLTHPDDALWVDAQGNPVAASQANNVGVSFAGLAPEAATGFNEQLNETLYGEEATIDATALPEGLETVADFQSIDSSELKTIFAGADDPANANNEKYQELLRSAPSPDIRISDDSANNIGGVPGKRSIINIGGRLMMIMESVSRETDGRNHDEFTIMDISSGTEKTFSGLSSDTNTVADDGVLNWANDL